MNSRIISAIAIRFLAIHVLWSVSFKVFAIYWYTYKTLSPPGMHEQYMFTAISISVLFVLIAFLFSRLFWNRSNFILSTAQSPEDYGMETVSVYLNGFLMVLGAYFIVLASLALPAKLMRLMLLLEITHAAGAIHYLEVIQLILELGIGFFMLYKTDLWVNRLRRYYENKSIMENVL